MMRDKCALNIWEAEWAIIRAASTRRTGKEDEFDRYREVVWRTGRSTGCGDLNQWVTSLPQADVTTGHSLDMRCSPARARAGQKVGGPVTEASGECNTGCKIKLPKHISTSNWNWIMWAWKLWNVSVWWTNDSSCGRTDVGVARSREWLISLKADILSDTRYGTHPKIMLGKT